MIHTYILPQVENIEYFHNSGGQDFVKGGGYG